MASGDYVVGRDIDFHISGGQTGPTTKSASVEGVVAPTKKKGKKRSKKKKPSSHTASAQEAGESNGTPNFAGDAEALGFSKSKEFEWWLNDPRFNLEESLQLPPQMSRLKSNPVLGYDRKNCSPGSAMFTPEDIKWFKRTLAERREDLTKFWQGLSNEARESLIKIDKKELFDIIRKERRECTCSACGGKREAVDSELEELYKANEAFLKQYAEATIKSDSIFSENNGKFRTTKTGWDIARLKALDFDIPSCHHGPATTDSDATSVTPTHSLLNDRPNYHHLFDDSHDLYPRSYSPKYESTSIDLIMPSETTAEVPVLHDSGQHRRLQKKHHEILTEDNSPSAAAPTYESDILNAVTSPMTTLLAAVEDPSLLNPENSYDDGSGFSTTRSTDDIDTEAILANILPPTVRDVVHNETDSKPLDELDGILETAVAGKLTSAHMEPAHEPLQKLVSMLDPSQNMDHHEQSQTVKKESASSPMKSHLSSDEIATFADDIISHLKTGESDTNYMPQILSGLEPLFVYNGISEHDRYRVFLRLMDSDAIKKHTDLFNRMILHITNDLVQNNGEEVINILEDLQRRGNIPAPESSQVAPTPKTKSEKDVMDYYNKMKGESELDKSIKSEFDLKVEIGGLREKNDDSWQLSDDTLDRGSSQLDLDNSSRCSLAVNDHVTAYDDYHDGAISEQKRTLSSASQPDSLENKVEHPPRLRDEDLIERERLRLTKASLYLHNLYSRIFEYKLLKLYREHLARKKQQLLLAELAEEEERAASEALRKSREKDRKKSKKLLAKQQREEEAQRKALEEKRKLEAAREKEEARRAQQLESDRMKQEAHRRKIEKRMAQLALESKQSSPTHDTTSPSDILKESPTRQDSGFSTPTKSKNDPSEEGNPQSESTLHVKVQLEKMKVEKSKLDRVKLDKAKTDRAMETVNNKSEATRSEKEKEKERLKQERIERSKLEKFDRGDKVKLDKTKSEKSKPASERIKVENSAANHKDERKTTLSGDLSFTSTSLSASKFHSSPGNSRTGSQRFRPEYEPPGSSPSSVSQHFMPNSRQISSPGMTPMMGYPTGNGHHAAFTPHHVPTNLLSVDSMPSVIGLGTSLPSSLPNANVSLESELSSNLGPGASTGMGPHLPSSLGSTFSPNLGSGVDRSLTYNSSGFGNVGVGTPVVPSSVPSSGGPQSNMHSHSSMNALGLGVNTKTSLGANMRPSLSGHLSHDFGGSVGSNLGASIGNNVSSSMASTIATQPSRNISMSQQLPQQFHSLGNLWLSAGTKPSGSGSGGSANSTFHWGVPWRDGKLEGTPPPQSSGTNSPWKNHQRASDLELCDAARKGYEEVKHLGVDGLVPSQVLFHAADDKLAHRFSQQELYRACAKMPSFQCVRDDVGLITHIKM